MKRLFTFGCSFTQYWRWPTWADMLGQQWEFFENWGLCGAGNSYILYSLIECNQRNKITPDDAVYIMWTNTSREDRYVGDRWLEGGNVYWDGHPLGPEYVKHFACERGYLIRDLAVIAAVEQLLDSWQCDWRFFCMVPLGKTNQENNLGYHPVRPSMPDPDVRELYQHTLQKISPSVLDVVFQGNWFTGDGIADCNDPKRRDFHPTPREHAEYIKQVAPELILDERCQQWMWQCDELARADQLAWKEPNRPTWRL